ncbi:hypothetical protein HacjB3_18178 (plasmid) [Halalkalicoccus jeotgali B3]|uniref:DUF7845 domain-containing protein n=1 Tax=Halalkalicoccus jeotgali (strain DSM 18796 / CECT 7217 / JCM 14584 / KCTC 4019 / B3) TaxID=795797 RepID=D8JC40_HALJB|nr:hypothetical protein [Halalkalicoccus jeotgali]ADJ16947.1 hypothetical protein HacjB3_18023 [Halalkalicoccus jeotgali B3]ADJ16978.1 hypothetical protein HacjB3_18178 [Halalkalicoccus jeotgali B3]
MSESRFLLETAVDEFGGNLIYTGNDLLPHFALDKAVKDADGSARARFDRGDETWVATLSYQESGLAPRDHPDYRLQTVREHRITVKPVEDQAGKRRARFHVAPRWPDMRTTDGDSISTPDIVGVNVRAQGAKLDFGEYPELLRGGAEALDINPAYFTGEHSYSNIYEAETYVRVNRSKSGRVFGRGSVMERIFELAAESGKYRKLVEDDTGGDGFMHMAAFRPETAGALISGHEYGKRIKHYLLKNPPEDPSDPLYHPKVCMLFKKSLNTSTVPWSDKAGLRRELDEQLLNLLSWAGLPTRPNESSDTYVPDGYFEDTDTIRPTISLIDDPTPDIKREQGTAVIKALAGLGTGNPDLNNSDAEALQVMADGGQVQDVTSLAEAIGRSRRTVYRIVDRLSDLLTLENGAVAFGSDYLASQARHGLRHAREAFENDGKGSGESSAWSAWCAEYGPEVSDRFPDADITRVKLEFGEIPDEADMEEMLKEGLTAWIRSGRDKVEYVAGRAFWRQNGEGLSTSDTPGSRAGGMPDTVPSRSTTTGSDLKSVR